MRHTWLSLWSSLWPQKHLVRHLTSVMILLQSQDELYSPQETFGFFLPPSHLPNSEVFDIPLGYSRLVTLEIEIGHNVHTHEV